MQGNNASLCASLFPRPLFKFGCPRSHFVLSFASRKSYESKVQSWSGREFSRTCVHRVLSAPRTKTCSPPPCPIFSLPACFHTCAWTRPLRAEACSRCPPLQSSHLYSNNKIRVLRNQPPGLREEALEAAVPARHLRGIRHGQRGRRRAAHDVRRLPESDGEIEGERDI